MPSSRDPSPLAGLFGARSRRALVEARVSQFIRDVLGPERLSADVNPLDEHEQAFDEGWRRRERVFGMSRWSLRNALSMLARALPFEELDASDSLRVTAKTLAKPGGYKAWARLDEAATPWTQALGASHELLETVDFTMHPLLWLRWANTFAPQAIQLEFWTEFGLWRHQFGAAQPVVRAVDGDGKAVHVADSSGILQVLLPLDAFVQAPLYDAAAYKTRVEVLSVINGGALQAALVDHLTHRLNASSGGPDGDPQAARIERVRRRVGQGTLSRIAEALDALRSLDWDASAAGLEATVWLRQGYMWQVSCTRAALAARVADWIRERNPAVPMTSTTLSALSAFVSFPSSHKPRGLKATQVSSWSPHLLTGVRRGPTTPPSGD
jgi:hypothetical protein